MAILNNRSGPHLLCSDAVKETMSLPEFAPFPPLEVMPHLDKREWESVVTAWDALSLEYLAQERVAKPPTEFLLSFVAGVLGDPLSIEAVPQGPSLVQNCFRLTNNILQQKSPPSSLLDWPFILDISKLYHNNDGLPLLLYNLLQVPEVEANLGSLKKNLIKLLEDGISGNLGSLEELLARLNHLVNASPDAAVFFLAGSDFLDGLIHCYKITNPPLRSTIITTTYVCLVGLAKGSSPKFSLLTDQLYSLKSSAESHRAGPLNVNDSMVAELVTATPLLKLLRAKFGTADALKPRATAVLDGLAGFKKPGGVRRPLDGTQSRKGKAMAIGGFGDSDELRVHRLSEIDQVHDLFPHLGKGFISRMFNACGANMETVVSNLLENSIPNHLQDADQTEDLAPTRSRRRSSLMLRSTPPVLSTRRNVFDDDELDKLELDVSKLRFGKSRSRNADDLLAEPSDASKAAVLSALEAFDLDDDERDDTYDADDVGGAIDIESDEEISATTEKNDETLFKAYKADPKVFNREKSTRNGLARARLRLDTGLTDEAIEGWAIMLERNPKRLRNLGILFTSAQPELPSTHWRRSATNSEDSDSAGLPATGSITGSRGRSSRGGGRGKDGNVERSRNERNHLGSRRRKEANKSSRANHNRRNQRAKKMMRGGGQPG